MLMFMAGSKHLLRIPKSGKILLQLLTKVPQVLSYISNSLSLFFLSSNQLESNSFFFLQLNRTEAICVVLKSMAVDKINTVIGPALVGKDPTDQTGIDNFILQQVHEHGWCSRNLGANATMAVSTALCKAGAGVLNIPLYQHIANLEFAVLPVGADSFKEAMGMGSVVKKKFGQDATNVGDEGGFSPKFQEYKEVLEVLETVIDEAGYTGKVLIGIDVADMGSCS
ncbi:hypothetical protein LXL04_032393 [Taraxacum kok-saghyz]